MRTVLVTTESALFMVYVDVDILAIPWESRGAALIYFTVRPNRVVFKELHRLSRGRGRRVTTL